MIGHQYKLTGKWYAKKRKLGGFDVMVEIIINDGDSPEKLQWRKATEKELYLLNKMLM